MEHSGASFIPPAMERMGSELGSRVRPGWFGGFGRFGGRGFCGRSFGWGLIRCVLSHKKVVAAVAVVVVGVKIAKYYKMKKLREKWNETPKDVVVLHTIPRGKVCPCLTPFSVKLETYFRMRNIKYVLDYEMPMGPKNKVPWITYNGEDYSDSELIIEMLEKKLKPEVNKNVSEVDRAAGHAIRIMLEEHLYWGLVHFRYVEDNLDTLFYVSDLSNYHKVLFRIVYKSMLKTALYYQGTGRHSTLEIHAFMRKDLKALSAFLGTKNYLLGDEPDVLDCAVFATLSQIVYNCSPSVYAYYISDEFKNLKAYTERMKTKFWQDWNKICLNPYMPLIEE